MEVINRKGIREPVSFDKILKRIQDLCYDLCVDPVVIAKDTIQGMFNGISTEQLDLLSSDICASKIHHHPDFNKLAARILITNKQRILSGVSYLSLIQSLYNTESIGKEMYDLVSQHAETYEKMIDPSRDFWIDYFGIKTLERSYLLGNETPQHMWLRVAIQIHGADFDNVLKSYNLMSSGYFTHATPTLFNAGTKRAQMSSCFLLAMDDDITKIFKTISDMAHISKFSGGIGVSISNIRAKGSLIKSTNGLSQGIIPLCKTIESVGRYINQCFVGETVVLTEFGPKFIRDIQVGENVLSEYSRYNPVSHVHKRLLCPDEKLFKITFRNMEYPLVCTGDHSVFVFNDKDEHREVFVRDLTPSDVLATPVGRPAHPSVRPSSAFFEKTFTCDNILEAEAHRMVFRNRGCISYMRYIDNKWFVIPYIKEVVQKYEKNTIASITSYIPPTEQTYVYDLTVEDDHTYATHGGLVHNSGKRMGSIACYLEPWHSDIESFIELRKNTGDENLRARDLFLALWVPDLFMKRVKNDEMWSLMCPSECPGLHDTFGDAFDELYIRYETEKKYKRQVRARDLWNKILEVQIETGMPYISYKDHANRKSNQSNIGIIKSSNLCVAPETRVLTREYGYAPIETLEGVDVHVWNGVEWSSTVIKKTSNASELLKVEFSNGEVMECTPEHIFYVNDGEAVPAKDLCNNTKLIESNLPSLHQSLKAEHRHFFEQMRIYRSYLFDNRDAIEGIYFKHENDKLIRLFRTILLEYGISAPVYVVQEITHLMLNRNNLYELRKRTGYMFYEEYKYDLTRDLSPLPVYAVAVTRTGRMDATYCFTESKRHMGVFNGILTGQCNEILEVANEEEVSVCNLASICLSRFVEHGSFNFTKLGEVVSTVVENLNKVIDLNYYPIKETHTSNMYNRPIGLGVQGLADTYIKLRLPFDSDEAMALNKQIFETIYYHAVKTSGKLSKRDGPYARFFGSPASRGELQFHMWNVDPASLLYEWDSIVEDVKMYGMRNSLLTALMPTASTSQIMGCNEAFEPITSNLYVRKTLAGEFIVVNEHLVRDLIERGLWSKEMYEEILYYNGSIQTIKNIPSEIKELYKTAYEIKMVKVLKQAIERGPFIDQTQSMNLFMKTPSFDMLNNALFYGWTHGLKTGMYYLRTQPVQSSIKFGIDPHTIQRIKEKESGEGEYCVKLKKIVEGKLEDCVVCSS